MNVHIRIELNCSNTFRTDTYIGRKHPRICPKDEMKLRNTHLLIAIAFALSASMIFTTNSFAIRPQGSGCSGLDCYGAGNGGYGNHLSGTSGSGNTAGYSQVRFDGFRPDPALVICNDDRGKTKKVLASLGLVVSADVPRYVHHRVAILRSDGKTVTNGVPGFPDALYWNSGLDFNLKTGATRTTIGPPNREPSHGDEWIGPQWLGDEVCLPLSGGTDILTELKEDPPQISVLYKGSNIPFIGNNLHPETFYEGMTKSQFSQQAQTNMGRIVVRSKDLTLRIAITESSVTNAGITIDFEAVKEQININVGSLEKFFEWIGNGMDLENARGIWEDATKKRAPIYADFSKVVINPSTIAADGTKTTTYDVPLIVRRKGIYSIQVDANYNAYVGGNNGLTTPFTGLTGTSTPMWVNAISIKSINRR